MLYPTAQCLGQDISQDMIMWANHNNQHPQVQFTFNDLEKCETQFDRVFSNAVFQWIHPLESFTRMLKTKVTHNARLYLTIYGPETYTELRKVLGMAQGKQAILASSGFLNAVELKNIFSLQWKHVSIDTQRIQRRFDSLQDLLRSIKLTGTRGDSSPQFHWTPGFLKQVESIYKEVYGTILVSYDIIYVKAYD